MQIDRRAVVDRSDADRLRNCRASFAACDARTPRRARTASAPAPPVGQPHEPFDLALVDVDKRREHRRQEHAAHLVRLHVGPVANHLGSTSRTATRAPAWSTRIGRRCWSANRRGPSLPAGSARICASTTSRCVKCWNTVTRSAKPSWNARTSARRRHVEVRAQPVEQRVRELVRDDVVRQAGEHAAVRRAPPGSLGGPGK